jgi:large repetitive protein
MAARRCVTALLLSLTLISVRSAQAGNLTATLHGTTLVVAGKGAVMATLSGVATGDVDPTAALVRIEPLTDTTVNGGASDITFTGVANVSVKLDNALNQLVFQGLELSGNLKVKGGKLADTLQIEGGSYGDAVTLDGGAGVNSLQCDGADIGGNLFFKASGPDNSGVETSCSSSGNLTITLGGGGSTVQIDDGARAETASIKGGTDTVTVGAANINQSMKISVNLGATTIIFSGTEIGGSLTVTAATGADSVKFDPITVGGDAKINLGNGANLMLAPGPDLSLIGGSLTVSAGTGADKFNLHSIQIGVNTILKAGNGANQLTLDTLTVGENLTVTAGSGDDHMTSTSNTVGGVTKINLGGGTNVGP